MSKKITIQGSNLLGTLSDDWGGINNGSSAVSIHGTSVPPKAEWGMNRGEVERFLKSQFKEKAGEFYYDSTTSKYLVFADEADRDQYLSDREVYADLLIGTFDAPANYTAEITMSTPNSNTILEGTTGNYIDFTFDVKTKTGSSTGEAVIATYTFNNSGNIRKETRIYDAGTSVHFLVDEYLNTGINSISVNITGRNTLASSMAAVTFIVVNLQLSSSFTFSTPVNKGTYLNIPYTLKGSNVKYLEWYVDGTKLSNVDTVVGLNVSGTKNIDTTELTVGKHNVQARAFITEGGTNYYSNTLYFDFLVCPANGEWTDNETAVLLGLVISSPLTSGTLSINIKQYETFDYKVSVYDSRERVLNLVITDNGDTIKSISITDASIINESYSPTTIGNHTILFTCDGQTATFTAATTSSDIAINEETSDVLLKLSAKGRSNNESNPATWTYQQGIGQGGNLISTTFTGFSWNSKSGWNNGALIIPAGASIQIGLNPLAGNPITKGRTIEIDFETTNIENEQASVLNLLNESAGLTITASTAKLQSAGGAKVETKFRDGDRIRLSFIINRTDDADNTRMLYIVNNGILERASQFGANDTIGISGDTMTIGSTGCDIKLYNISVYDKSLQVDQAFANYAVNNPNIISIASFNDIYDTNGGISVDKVNAHIPVMIVTGDISSIMSISDKSHKNDWNNNPVDIEFRNMQNPELNFFIDDADIRLQGTSSISYPRKNFRIYSKSKSGKYQTKLYTPTHNNEDLVTNGKYAFKEGSAPVSCWCLKADYAESSGSHNTGVARLWNNIMKNTISDGNYILRTNAQKWAAQNDYPYDVRTTIDGFPIVLFQRDSENSPLVCLGQYNFNNDKSTEDVFGFTELSKDGVAPFDNSKVECWEVLDSDNKIALFTDVSDFDSSWEDAFEARYPNKNKNVTALKTVAQFLNSCYDSTNDTVDVSTWRAGKADHFDLNKLAAYYVYLLRFGAVDQTVKNAMFTTEDGVHWFYINYDNDTVLGIDNESQQFDTWDYGLFTQTPNGGYYYAGKGKSVLWRLFEADSECMSLARQVDALLFNAGLTYENVLNTFDTLQSSQWCERIYNENGRYKYISQALEGNNLLHMLQGSRKSHRHWWLQHRFEKYDNIFGNGTYSIRSIQARSTGTVNIPQGSTYKFTPATTTYFGYAVASTTVDAPTERTAGTEYTSTGLPQDTGVGNLIYIYNANNIAAIDLSGYISALGNVDISAAKDVNGDSKLTKIVLGNGINTNSYLTTIRGLSIIKSIEEIDIRGYQAITNLDLDALENFHALKATNSGLTSFAPANGVSLTSVELPTTIQNIVLDGAEVTSITYTPTTSLRNVSLKNISGSWDAKSFVNSWIALLSDEQLAQAEVTLHGINWTGMTADQAIQLGKVATKSLRGKITLVSLNQTQYDQLVELYGANAFIEGGTFTIDAPTSVFITGPSELKEGESGTFVGSFFPTTEDSILYLLYNGTSLVSSQTDAQGKVYRTYNGVTLYEATGAVSVASGISSDVNVNVRAQIEGTSSYSEYYAFVGKKLTYPSTVNISGSSSIDRNGTYNYSKSFDTNSFNAEVQSVTWNLSSNSASNLASSDSSSATIQVTNTPSTSLQVTLTCTVTFQGGVTRTGTKSITMQLTYPSSVSISGDSSIIDNGSYNYTKSFNTNNFTASVTSVVWSLTSNTAVTLSAQTTNSATLTASNGNDTAVTLTLTCTVTLTGGVTRTATHSISVSTFAAPPTEEWVDLGLPSGLLWCNHNVGADSETGYGAYFSWGNIIGHTSSNGSSFDDGYNWGLSTNGAPYKTTPGYSLTGNITTGDATHDAAQANLGYDWRLPTKEEFQELYDNTDSVWTTINGVNGRKFMKKGDNATYVFFPASGCCSGASLYDRGSGGYYWSSSYNGSTGAYSIYFTSSSVNPQRDYGRYNGFSVRAVRFASEAIDLGLPSGTLWSDRNIGAFSATDHGCYFSWGNVEGHKSSNGSTFDDGYDWGSSSTGAPYNTTPGYSLTGNIASNDANHDVAKKVYGGSWHMPTKELFQELYDNTDREWVTNYNGVSGLNGYKFKNKTDATKFVFFPSSGVGEDTYLYSRGSLGRYWSSSYGNSYSAYYMYFSSSSVFPQYSRNRYNGMSIRPVQ